MQKQADVRTQLLVPYAAAAAANAPLPWSRGCFLQYLPRGFTADTVVEGKKAAREELRKRWVLPCCDVPGPLPGLPFDLPAIPLLLTWLFRLCRVNLSGWGDKPMVGVVSRLTKQKGECVPLASCSQRCTGRMPLGSRWQQSWLLPPCLPRCCHMALCPCPCRHPSDCARVPSHHRPRRPVCAVGLRA